MKAQVTVTNTQSQATGRDRRRHRLIRRFARSTCRGVTALKSVGIVVDPTSQRLKRLPAARLKRHRRT